MISEARRFTLGRAPLVNPSSGSAIEYELGRIMSVLRPHEVEVVRLLASERLSPEVLDEVIETASFVELDETGAGYLLTVRYSALPKERVVCHKPLLLGRSGDVECGFLVFLENGLLTLECHSWGDAPIPTGFREYDVAVSESA